MNKTQESDTETNVNAASVSESVGESETALRLRISQLERQLAAAQEALDGIALACKRVREGADKDDVPYCIETKARAAIDQAQGGGK